MNGAASEADEGGLVPAAPGTAGLQRATRIAIVSEHASPLTQPGGVDAGGQNVHVAALAVALARRGHAVRVYTRRESADVARRVVLAPGVTVLHVDAGPAHIVPKDELLPYMGAFAGELVRDWRTDPPDVAHAHFWMSGLAAVDAAAVTGVPVVQTFHALGSVKRRHQGAEDSSPRARLASEVTLARSVDHIIATCTDEVTELLDVGAVPSRISVVPCGVDLDLFDRSGPTASRRAGLHRLLAVGRLVARKGIDDVVRALPHVPDTELVIAGGPPAGALASDPEAARILRVARQSGVEDRVVLLGQVARARMPALIRSADLMVCTPWYEPFGMAPLEAMACGVPVVARPVGGLAETVRDGITGIHVHDIGPAALGAAVTGLLADPARRRRMSAAAHRRARSDYSWERVARLTAEVYDRVSDRVGGVRR